MQCVLGFDELDTPLTPEVLLLQLDPFDDQLGSPLDPVLALGFRR